MGRKILTTAVVLGTCIVLSDAALASGNGWLPAPVQEWLDWVIQLAKDNPTWAALIVCVLAAGESLAFVSLIFPFWVALVAIGSAYGGSSNDGFTFGVNPDLMPIIIGAGIGAALGDWISYWLGYKIGPVIFKKWPLKNHPEAIAWGHQFFEKWGPWAIVFGRFLGPLRATVPIFAGIAGLSSLKFHLANWPSGILWAYVVLKFGDVIGKAIVLLRGLF